MEFARADFEQAEAMASKIGFKRTLYTSGGDLSGLICLPNNPKHPENNGNPKFGGMIIKTLELGMIFKQSEIDLQ